MNHVRLGFILAAVFLTTGAVRYWREARVRYWILRDGVQVPGRVTKEGWHDTIEYRYAVGGQDLTGRGPREWREPRYREVRPGGQTPVWYSRSRPWISTPRKPAMVLEGVMWVVIVMFLDAMCIVFIFWPSEGSSARVKPVTSPPSRTRGT